MKTLSNGLTYYWKALGTCDKRQNLIIEYLSFSGTIGLIYYPKYLTNTYIGIINRRYIPSLPICQMWCESCCEMKVKRYLHSLIHNNDNIIKERILEAASELRPQL